MRKEPSADFAIQDELKASVDGASDLRMLIVSQRNLNSHVSLGYLYEFEDIVCEIDNCDLACPQYLFGNNSTLYEFMFRASNKMIRLTSTTLPIRQFTKKIKPHQKYELLFLCLRPDQLLLINSISNFRKNFERTACYIDELWPQKIERGDNVLKLLRNFDNVFVGFKASAEPLSNLINRPCHYLPFGIDALRFCPYPMDPPRVIDLYSLGRRSERTHIAALEFEKVNRFFYIHDTLRNYHMRDYKEHRNFVAALAKRSRYFLANRSKFNGKANGEGDEVVGRNELTTRFLEGGAAGAVIIGDAPTGEVFRKQLDWDDSVINFPLDGENIGEFVAELDKQPDRLKKIRRDNVVNCLMRHDWVYRWEVVLEKVGLPPRPELEMRKRRLNAMADYIRSLSD